jgi:TonB family protein
VVKIRYKIQPNGQVMNGSLVQEESSGDPALDRAAMGAITTSVFPPLPVEFKGPYLEVRFHFMYNEDRLSTVSHKAPHARYQPGLAGITVGYKAKL